MPEPVFMKLGTYITETEPISAPYFINPSHQSVSLYVYPSYRCKTTAPLSVFFHSVIANGSANTFPRQRIHATVEELLDASFSMRFMPYQRRVYGSACVCPYRY
jgi:hypothetical protein